MKNLTIAEAKKEFAYGLLARFKLERAPMDAGYTVEALAADLGTNAGGLLVDARTKQPRVFKSLDSAIATLRQIGFDTSQLVGQ